MSLSIDQSKVNEQLAKSPPAYVVSPCNLEIVTVPPQAEIPATNVTSTIGGVPPEVERYRDQVLSLRQHLIDKGEHPASSPEELERIINETRGR